MTTPTAAATILVLFDCATSSAYMITFAFEITLMTGSTEGRVAGRWIDKRRGYAITVTRATTWIIPVIARVIPLGIMTEYGRCPALRRMTLVAFKSRLEMVRRFADRSRAIVAG